MKELLRQLSLSWRLDSAAGEKVLAGHQHASVLASVDRQLRQELPRCQAPACLHDSILRRIGTPAESEPATAVMPFNRWLPVPAFGVMLLMGIWVLHSRESNPAPSGAGAFTPAAAALAAGQQLPGTVPQLIVGPLSVEWEKVNRDLARTAEFLMASVP